MRAARSGLDGFVPDLRSYLVILGERVRSYVRLVDLLISRLEGGGLPERIRDRFEAAWRERRFSAAYDRPALLLASIRGDALAEGASHPLFRAVAVDRPVESAATEEALVAALAPDRERLWRAVSERRVQTNETARAVAWLWPARLARAGSGERPIALVDLGASAGLNLVADELPSIWTDERGAALPVATAPRVVSRLGIDARPIDAGDDDAVAWLRACLWPGEMRRLARFEAAIAAFRAAGASAAPPAIETRDLGGAGERLSEVARASPPGTLVLAYQTLVREYLPPAERAEYVGGMERFIESSQPLSALWVELEMSWDGETPKDALLTAHARGVDGRVSDLEIGRCSYHPVGISVIRDGVSRLEALFAAPATRSEAPRPRP